MKRSLKFGIIGVIALSLGATYFVAPSVAIAKSSKSKRTQKSKPTRPRTAAEPASAAPEFVIGAVGDLVCDESRAKGPTECRQVNVSDAMVADKSLQSVLLLGDLEYDTGALSDFQTEYARTYGRLNSIAIPAPGNHEYGTANAAGYFSYFDAKAHPETNGYYSVDISKSWHVIVLNSNCDFIGGCGKQSAQMKWLEADLVSNTRPCSIAIWHHPLFSSSERGANEFMRPLWDTLDAAKTDLVLVGHEHQYERFAPQHGDGTAAVDGIRQFVIGTGGRSIYPFKKPVSNSEVRQTGFGFVRFELRPNGYSWNFVNDPASPPITDSGSAACH